MVKAPCRDLQMLFNWVALHSRSQSNLESLYEKPPFHRSSGRRDAHKHPDAQVGFLARPGAHTSVGWTNATDGHSRRTDDVWTGSTYVDLRTLAAGGKREGATEGQRTLRIECCQASETRGYTDCGRGTEAYSHIKQAGQHRRQHREDTCSINRMRGAVVSALLVSKMHVHTSRLTGRSQSIREPATVNSVLST